MLIQLGEVKQFLADSSRIDTAARLSVLIDVHVAKVLDLRLRHFELIIQMLDAVVTLLLGTTNDAVEAALLAVEDDHRALLLVLEQLIVLHDLLTTFFGVAAAEQDL